MLPSTHQDYRHNTDRYAYSDDNPTTWSDPTGLITAGVCVGASASLIGWNFGISLCVAVGVDLNDGKLSAGVERTLAVGGLGSTKGASVGVGIGLQFSTANHVEDLKGPFGYVGGSFRVAEAGIVADGFAGSDDQGNAVYGIDAQYSPGAGVSLGGGASTTKIVPLNQFWNHWTDLFTKW